MQLYGIPMKDIIQKKFRDGIISAINFTINGNKIASPKGERIKVLM